MPKNLSSANHFRKTWKHLLSADSLSMSANSQSRSSSRTPKSATRTAFHKDYDRLIFSQSFRQLNQKTQVHPLVQQMGIHTRLTHSLEVSCVGRSLGMLCAEKISDCLPRGVSGADIGVIVQAACLAHDIGNPPFGHAGEYAIRDWFYQPAQAELLQQLTPRQQTDLVGYEGNAQGFRLLTRNEHHPDRGGMRLTAATLGAFVKYPYLSTPSNLPNVDGSLIAPTQIRKFGCFDSEAKFLQQLGDSLKLVKTEYGFARHPLAYLLEAADDICYALIDLEDGILLGMLDYAEVEPLLLQLVGKRLGTPPEVTHNAPIAQKLAALRGRAMRRLVDKVTDAFVNNQAALLAGELEGSLFEHCPSHVKASIAEAKQLAHHRIFQHPSKVRTEIMASQCLHTLLDAFMPLALLGQTAQLISRFEQMRLLTLVNAHLANYGRQLGDDVYHNALCILDMITAMNDHEAYHLAQELKGNLPMTR